MNNYFKTTILVFLGFVMVFLTSFSALASGEIGDYCSTWQDCNHACDGRDNCKPLCMEGIDGFICFAGYADDNSNWEGIYLQICAMKSDCSAGEFCVAGVCTDTSSEYTNNPFDISEEIIWDVINQEIQDGYLTFDENINENRCSDGTVIGLCSETKPKYCNPQLGLISEPLICGCPEGEILIEDPNLHLMPMSDVYHCIPEEKYLCILRIAEDGHVYWSITEDEEECEEAKNPVTSLDYTIILVGLVLVALLIFFVYKGNKAGILLVVVIALFLFLFYGFLGGHFTDTPEEQISDLENVKQEDLNGDGVIDCKQELAQSCSLNYFPFSWFALTGKDFGCCVNGLTCDDLGQIHPFDAKGVCV